MDELSISATSGTTQIKKNSAISETELTKKMEKDVDTVFKNPKANDEKPVKNDDTKKMVAQINDFVKSFSTKLSFSVDPESSRPIIMVTEKESGKLIRQIPSEEMLVLVRKMEEISGIIFHRRI